MPTSRSGRASYVAPRAPPKGRARVRTERRIDDVRAERRARHVGAAREERREHARAEHRADELRDEVREALVPRHLPAEHEGERDGAVDLPARVVADRVRLPRARSAQQSGLGLGLGGAHFPQSEPRWRRVWDLWGGARGDVHTDPTKQAVHKSTMLTDMLFSPASIVVRTRLLDLVCQLCEVPGHCLLEHPPD